MDGIRIGVFGEHRLLMEGLCRLLVDCGDMRIVLKETSVDKLLDNAILKQVQVLILHPGTLNDAILEVARRIGTLFPKIGILLVSTDENEAMLQKTIKSGAKGFLAKESGREDLLEAVYTLRNGRDYYSKSITRILLKQYIAELHSEQETEEGSAGSISLSAREREILKLWGDSYTNREISERLYISIRTVESHKNHIMQKLNLKTTVDLVKFGIRNNIIDL